MKFQLRQVSSYGTATPAVARTFIQGNTIAPFLGGDEKQRDVFLGVLLELQDKLLRCVAIHEELATIVAKTRKDVDSGALVVERDTRVLRPPSVLDLQNKAESFLQAAKLCIAEATID